MNILNLTQHTATEDQLKAGVVEPTDKLAVQQLLTFEELPGRELIRSRATALATLVAESGHVQAMIGGAPFFMAPLEQALRDQGVKSLYSFTRRESHEVPDGNGGVRKTQVFRHVAFIEAARV